MACLSSIIAVGAMFLVVTACNPSGAGGGSEALDTTALDAVAAPMFSPAGGSYTSVQTVTISSTTAGASIRYTLDGTAPSSTAGTNYSSSITIASTTVLKAIAYKAGLRDSAVVSAGYTISASTAAPSTPSGLAVSGPTQTSQLISWNASTGATGYRLYRSLSSSGPWTEQINAASPGSTSFVDNGLTPNAIYYYKVLAYNASGSSSLSAWVSGTTSALPSSIATIAGGGASSPGDGGPATAVALNTVCDLAADSLGNVYIAEQGNSRVRKINTSGTISTVAGNGTAGHSGDGGLATAATLAYPLGVALDNSGNLYIVEGNYVRKVNTAGIISTVAGNGSFGFSGDGGPATSAAIYAADVAVDASGNLYIADFNNNRIRKVSSGIITTVAGTGGIGNTGDGGPAASATILHPQGIDFDALGNLYVCAQSSFCVRKISASGIITTVIGNPSVSILGDGGPAANARINPLRLAFDSAGRAYVVDQSHRIRKVDLNGIISTVAGTGVSGFSGDGGPATSAKLYFPVGVALDSTGRLYIADGSNNRVRMVQF
jgi:hypothetical protein